jgi:hypothetical protein
MLNKQTWALVFFGSVIHGAFYVKDDAAGQSQSGIFSSIIGAAIAAIFLPIMITSIVIVLGNLTNEPLSKSFRHTVFLITWGLWILALHLSR